MDPNYGEIDFEYLPNGGWGQPGGAMFYTTWETYRPDPWEAVNVHDVSPRSFAGWHDLVAHVAGGHVRYFLDGIRVADRSGMYYPETPMSMNFNTWSISLDGHTGATSTYRQEIDYVLHTAGEVLTPAEVKARVNGYRAAGLSRTNTMGSGGDTCEAPGVGQPSAKPPVTATQTATPAVTFTMTVPPSTGVTESGGPVPASSAVAPKEQCEW